MRISDWSQTCAIPIFAGGRRAGRGHRVESVPQPGFCRHPRCAGRAGDLRRAQSVRPGRRGGSGSGLLRHRPWAQLAGGAMNDLNDTLTRRLDEMEVKLTFIDDAVQARSEEHTTELQSLIRL